MMGRYCPQFTASTGEKVTWRPGGHTIGQPHSAVIFPETNLRKPGYFTLNPITLFINGQGMTEFAKTKPSIKEIKQWYPLPTCPAC